MVDTLYNKEIILNFQFNKHDSYYSVLYEKGISDPSLSLENIGELTTDKESTLPYNQISKHLYFNQADTILTISLYRLSEDLYEFLRSAII